MTVETATYIHQFNVNYPESNAAITGGDNHLRLIKTALKNTFPNISGPITDTHTTINLNMATVTAATNANTASTLVKRDASGNFSAGTITASLTGNVTGNTSGTHTGPVTGNVTGGTVTADGLTVEGSATISGVSNANLQLQSTGGNIYQVRTDVNDVFIYNGTGARPLVKFAYGGDISFYEDTGITPKFFWDASAERLGIGTSSPSSFSSNANNLVVGSGSGTEGITINSGSANYGTIYFADGTSGSAAYAGNINYNHADNSMRLGTNGSTTDVVIDSSGNLLVGKTSGPNYNVVGVDITYLGEGQFTVNNGEVLQLNRKSSDGTIANFRKDGTTVGSIGTDASRFKIKSNSIALYLENESNKQLVWGNVSGVPYFYPQSDNDTNIGYPTQRFKDLYLSGELKGNAQTATTAAACTGNAATATNSTKWGGYNVSTSATGTDANTIYFRT